MNTWVRHLLGPVYPLRVQPLVIAFQCVGVFCAGVAIFGVLLAIKLLDLPEGLGDFQAAMMPDLSPHTRAFVFFGGIIINACIAAFCFVILQRLRDRFSQK